MLRSNIQQQQQSMPIDTDDEAYRDGLIAAMKVNVVFVVF